MRRTRLNTMAAVLLLGLAASLNDYMFRGVAELYGHTGMGVDVIAALMLGIVIVHGMNPVLVACKSNCRI